MNIENTYWKQNGKYQAEYDRLTDELVPDMGACDTLAGELLRSASRLAYDFYNNGMGNNTSGALNFLREHNVIDTSLYGVIYPYTTGSLYPGDYKGDLFHVAIEMVVDKTVKNILDNPELLTKENNDDMFDYSDPDDLYDED